MYVPYSFSKSLRDFHGSFIEGIQMVLEGVPVIPGDLAETLESTQIGLTCDPCFLSRL